MSEALRVELIGVGELQEYERNSRVHSAEQVTEIARSIGEFGFTNPILVNKAGRVIAGHGRLAAARELGIDAVPAIRLSHLTEEQERALVIADNRIAENATWDSEILAAELQSLSDAGFGIDLLGFSDEELDEMIGGSFEDGGRVEVIGDPDEVPDVSPEPVSRPGDLWVLGDHRVLCGSATVEEDVRCVVGGDGVDAVWTDPPYNVDYSTAAGSIKNDNLKDDEFLEFLRRAFRLACDVMSEGASIYVAHSDTQGLAFRAAFSEAGLKLSGCLVWVKPALVLGRSDYQWRPEPILYGWKPGAAHRWFGGRAQTTVLDDLGGSDVRAMPDGSLQIDIGDRTLVVTGERMSVSAVDGSVIRVDKPRKSEMHPTMKPVDLILRNLENSTVAGDVVFDPFGGSGSTLVACEMSRRKARLIELDPAYVDVIVKRWESVTGRLAELDGVSGFDALRVSRESDVLDEVCD